MMTMMMMMMMMMMMIMMMIMTTMMMMMMMMMTAHHIYDLLERHAEGEVYCLAIIEDRSLEAVVAGLHDHVVQQIPLLWPALASSCRAKVQVQV